MTIQNDPLVALSLLTRLPLRVSEEAYARSASAAWAYPLVGIVTGLMSSLTAGLALWLGLPVWCAAIVALGAGMVCTGAMHEDGLADCADGFWGGWDPAMRLKIMKDSQIGTYGVLALLISVALRIGALSTLLTLPAWPIALIAIHVASRAVMPVLMANLPHARDTGLSRSVGKVSASTARNAGLIGLAALIIGFGWSGIPLALLAALAAFATAAIAKSKIGGQTGDVIGASQQITEVALLLATLTA